MAESVLQNLHFRTHVLDNVSFTAIYVSADCIGVTIVNGGDDLITLRTDPNSSASEQVIYPGGKLALDLRRSQEGIARVSVPLVYAKTAGSTGPLILEEVLV